MSFSTRIRRIVSLVSAVLMTGSILLSCEPNSHPKSDQTQETTPLERNEPAASPDSAEGIANLFRTQYAERVKSQPNKSLVELLEYALSGDRRSEFVGRQGKLLDDINASGLVFVEVRPFEEENGWPTCPFVRSILASCTEVILDAGRLPILPASRPYKTESTTIVEFDVRHVTLDERRTRIPDGGNYIARRSRGELSVTVQALGHETERKQFEVVDPQFTRNPFPRQIRVPADFGDKDFIARTGSDQEMWQKGYEYLEAKLDTCWGKIDAGSLPRDDTMLLNALYDLLISKNAEAIEQLESLAQVRTGSEVGRAAKMVLGQKLEPLFSSWDKASADCPDFDTTSATLD